MSRNSGQRTGYSTSGSWTPTLSGRVIAAECIGSSSSALLCHDGECLDFDKRARVGQRHDLHERARRKAVAEIADPQGTHLLALVQTSHKRCQLDHVAHRTSAGLERESNLFERLFGLARKVRIEIARQLA